MIKDLKIIDPGIQFSNFEKLMQWLTGELEIMIDRDFHGLMNLLYRIDVNESKTKLAFATDHPAETLASLIIERELEKVETRKRYKE